MSLNPKIIKVQNDFLNIYNDFANQFNLKTLKTVNSVDLIEIEDQIVRLKIDNYHEQAFRKIITELLNVTIYSSLYTNREISKSLRTIEKNQEMISGFYLNEKNNNYKNKLKVNITDIRKDTSVSKPSTNFTSTAQRNVTHRTDSYNNSHRKVSKHHQFENDETSDTKLLELLEYISDKSKEAIMGPDEFSDVKQYLHVKTKIQEELEEVVNKVNQSDESQLVILCGNVGDGKSHLISYLNKEKPESFSNFTLYNDATESTHPSKTAIDTLEEKLESFNDMNISTSNEKMILAINIGVLNNFVNKMSGMGKYEKLINFLNKSVLYKTDGNKVSKNEKIHIVSFFDHPNLKLQDGNIQSSFYESIFNRIFNKNKDNIFYKAYLEDKSRNEQNIIHYNYELMLNKNIREKIMYIIYRIQIQYNVIISVRALNNFIYDILVPNNIEEPSYNDFLPYLLFDNQNESEIFEAVKRLDPIGNINAAMNKKFNNLNIAYYNSENFYETTKNLISDRDVLEVFDNMFEEINHLPSNPDRHKVHVISYLRIMYLFRPNNNIVDDDIYFEYIELLSVVYEFINNKNNADTSVINKFRMLVVNTIKKWNGALSENKIFIDNDTNSNIATAINFDLKFSSIDIDDYSIIIKFNEKHSRLEHSLTVDFNLFKLLKKVEFGYILKEQDKKENIYFEQFMNSIIFETTSLDSTEVLNKETMKSYVLVDNGLGIEIN